MNTRSIETHLNFFNGFEYDPDPEADAMVVVLRGGIQGVQKCSDAENTAQPKTAAESETIVQESK